MKEKVKIVVVLVVILFIFLEVISWLFEKYSLYFGCVPIGCMIFSIFNGLEK
mgnify:CR=1 FL=1